MNALRNEQFDAIVVGSGITGGWAAKELCEKGLRVLVLERGRNLEDETHVPPLQQPGPHPVLKNMSQDCVGPVEEWPVDWYVSDHEQPYVTPEDKPFRWIRSYHLGGRSLHWLRHCYRWSDLDFKANHP